jgi:predicted branched-subunit amino acid permease
MTTRTPAVAAGADSAPLNARTRSPAAVEARRGAVAMLPVLIGYVPFAAIVGTTVARHQEFVAAWVATWLIYGGAAHLAVLATVSAGSGVVLAAVAGILVNTRLVVYSATMARHWGPERRRFRALAAALLTDAAWLLALARYDQPGTRAERRWYYLGAATTLFVSWNVMITVAALLGNRIPVEVDLTVAMPLCLLAMVSPSLRSRGGVAAAGAAVVAALTTAPLPAGTGVLVAAAAGALAGCLVDRAGRGRSRQGGAR